MLLKRWLPEVAMVFVKQRKAWASLVPRYPSYIYFYILQYLARARSSLDIYSRNLYHRFLDCILFPYFYRKKGESLRQVEKFFLCVRAMMSMHLRSMCIKTLEDFISYMRTYMVRDLYPHLMCAVYSREKTGLHCLFLLSSQCTGRAT